MTSARQDGFTLLELLLALVIFSIIGTGVYQTLRSGVDAQRHGEESVQVTQIARQVLARMAADLRATYTSQGVYAAGLVGEDQVGQDVDLDRLTFAMAGYTPKPDAVAEFAVAKVEYFIDDDPATENVGLQRRITPIVELAVQEESEGEDYAPEVKSLNFRYYDGTNWLDTWDSTADGLLPLAVEVTIGLALGEESQNGSYQVLRRFSTTVRLPVATRASGGEE
jgi:general secretion pathway protein J